MPKRFVYLLEHCESGQPTTIGIFTTRQLAEDHLRDLDRSYAYAMYQLPLDTILTVGDQLADQQGIYDHWHYGTHQVNVVETDREGNVVREARKAEVVWPE